MGKQEAFAFLLALEAKGIRLGLARVRKFLRFAGSPEREFKSVHVAGTNGKGSTCAMIERVLREAGFRTGFYSSPHLVEFNERIKVDGEDISDGQLVPLIEETKRQMDESKIGLTYFEFITAVAFRHFAQQKVDFAVVEAGMGGRLDATNVLKPVVSVITGIDLEHEAYLGGTLEKIALEKAGIIKKRVPMATAERKEAVLRVFREKCRGQNALLVAVKEPYKKKIGLLGSFQKWNAAVALAAVRQLQEQGVDVGESAIERGIAAAEWPGRFQIVHRKPAIVLDCAHNPACCAVLAKTFAEVFPEKKALLVFGASSDKNVNGMVQNLLPLAERVFATNASIRAMEPEKIAALFASHGINAEAAAGVENALRKAISAAKESDVVLVAGSCFVVGEAMAALDKRA